MIINGECWNNEWSGIFESMVIFLNENKLSRKVYFIKNKMIPQLKPLYLKSCMPLR